MLVPLGQFAYQVLTADLGIRPRPRFAHGAEIEVPAGTAGNELRSAIVCSYHVSQQNTFTGTLTPDMLDAVLRTARGHAGLQN